MSTHRNGPLHNTSESNEKTYNRPLNGHLGIGTVDGRKRAWLSRLALALFACCLVMPAPAAEAPWAEREYRYVVIEQDVRDVLQEFGRNLSLPVEISDAVEGEVHGDIHASTAGDFLEQVCATNGLAWFYDGYVLHVAAREELSRRTFDLAGVDVPRLRAEIERAEIGKPLSARVGADRHRLEVSGPPAWIADMAQRIEGLRRPIAPSTPAGVKVFRGSVAQPPDS